MTTQGPALSIRYWPLAALLALVVWMTVAHAQVRVDPELGDNSCEVTDDCVAILCPCDWAVLAADNAEQLADCGKLQTISRCALGAAPSPPPGPYGALAYAETDGGRGDSATEIVEAIITRVDDSHAHLDVVDLIKGEYVPKEIRVRPSGPPLTTIVEVGNRYILFLYDHGTIDPVTTYRVTEGGSCFCESPTIAMKAWDFKARYRDYEIDSERALRALLLAGEWRLYSHVDPVRPAGGYPIIFSPSGQASRGEVGEPEQIPDSWSIPVRAMLRLQPAVGPAQDYRFDAEHGVFLRTVSLDETPVLMVIAPKGFDFSSYRPPQP